MPSQDVPDQVLRSALRAKLEEIEALVRPIQERAERSRDRLQDRPPGPWRFALSNAKVEPDDGVVLGAIGRIERVHEPPGEIGLANALKKNQLFGAVGRWSRSITYELVLPAEIEAEQLAIEVGWNLVASLRLRCDAEFVVPAVADHSWSTIEGAPTGSVRVKLLEDTPQARALVASARAIDSTVATWVGTHHMQLFKLRTVSRFQMALSSLTSSYTTTDLRLNVASLWAGLEALAGVSQEISFRLSALLATLLTEPGDNRVAAYRNIRRLYNVRSKAVHGADVSARALREHAIEARALLRRCLLAITELGRVPTSEELEAAMLGVPLLPEP